MLASCLRVLIVPASLRFVQFYKMSKRTKNTMLQGILKALRETKENLSFTSFISLQSHWSEERFSLGA